MITVVKCGGQVLDDASLFKSFCRDFAALEGPKVLVHGGGALAGKVQKALGMEPVKYEGRRVTDDATLQVVTMVYAGWCNKQMVALLQSFGCNAVGLAGCDGSVITAAKRPPKALSDGRVVDFGWVGDVTPDSVNAAFLQQLLDAGYTPVLCAINHDGAGQLLNTNADTVASSVAAALGASLVTCFEQPGVLEDRNDPSSVIPFIDKDLYASLKERGVVADGMIPKLDQAFDALDKGAAEVRICHSSALLQGGGTLIRH
jgi:acetylglutamate kinase